MRRYVVEINTSVQVIDEQGHIIASRSGDRTVAVDIRGRERDLIVKQVTSEAAEDIDQNMYAFIQNTLTTAGNQL